MSNVIQFRKKPETDPRMWEVGFARYVMAVGLQTIANENGDVNTSGVIENMNAAVLLMAEADYAKMTKIVTNPLYVDRAFIGLEDVRAVLSEGVL